ncbi:MAG TPA: PAS domain-containing protein [Candidatus Binatia bacterium]|jgi:PAS domain-containing protein
MAPADNKRQAGAEIERTRSKTALQDSEQPFGQVAEPMPETIRLIIDSTPSLIHTALPDGYIDFFNQTWLRYVGLPLEKIQGNWTCAIHSDDVEGIGFAPIDIALRHVKFSPLLESRWHPPRLGSGIGKFTLAYGKRCDAR